ncbi:hypothetical protein DFH29DRAFT_870804 [Suillus ampliporus]|nr:hypothetical protein DFH29DRAFT_870804 [Suillus ampliporus]
MLDNHNSGSQNQMSYGDVAQALDEPIMLTTDIKDIQLQSTATGQPQLKVQIINPLASLFPDAQESPPVRLMPNSAVPIFSSIVSATVELAAHMENTLVCDSDPIDTIHIPQPHSTPDMTFVEYLSQAMHTNAAFAPSNWWYRRQLLKFLHFHHSSSCMSPIPLVRLTLRVSFVMY